MAKTVFTPLQETDDLNVVSTWLEQNRAARDKFGSLSRVTYARDETDQQIIENARRMVAEYDRIAGLVNSSRPAQQPQAQPQAQPGFGQAATGLILGNRRMNQEQRRLEAYGDTESKIVNENYQELQEARRRLAQVPDDRPFEQSKIRQEITTLEESLSPRSLRTSAARQVASDLVGQERTRFAEDHLRRLEERRSSLDPKDPNYDSDYATATSQIRNMNEYYRFTQDGLTDSERGLIRAGEEVASWGIVPRSLVTTVSGFVDMIASPFNIVSLAAGGRPSSQRFISEGLTSPERRSFSETTGEWTADKRSWLSNQMAQTMYSLPMTVLTMANAPIGVGLTYTNMVDMNLTDMVRKYGTINDVPVASLAGSITAGLISGGVESLSNVVQVGLVNKLFKTTGFTGAKNYLKNVLTNKGMLLQLGRSVGTGALVEGAEEWVDSFAGNLVYNMVGEQNKSLSEMVAESNQAFISGAFGGALFGIFGGATQAFTQRGHWAETKKLAQIKTPGTNITSTQAKLVMDITAEMQKDSPNIDSVREMTSALYNQLDNIKNKSVKAAAANILDVTYANGIANTIFEEMQRQYPDSDILQGLDTATLSKDIYSLYQRANELIPKDTKATGIKAGLVNTIRAALQEASFGRTDKAKVLIARLNKLAKLKNVSSDPFFGKYSGILEDLTAIVGKMDSAVVEYANLSQTQAPVQRPAELDVTLIDRAKELQQKKSASVEELQALSSELGEAINSTEAGKEANAYAAWKRVVDDRINKKLERSRKVEEPEAPVVVTPAPVVTEPVEPVKPVKPVTPVNAGQKASILKLKAEKAVTDADYKAMISAITEGRTESVNDLTMGEAASIIDRLQELPLRKKKSEPKKADTKKSETKPRVDNKAAEERLAANKAKNEAKNKELRANALAAIKDLSVETFAKAKVAIMKGLDVLTPSEMEQAAKKLDELRPLLDTGYSNDAMIVSEILNKAAEEQRYEESKAVEGTEDVPAKSEEEQANEFLRKSGIDPIPDTPTEPKSVTQIEAELSAIDKKIDKLEAAIAAREDKGLDATDKQQRDLDALEQQRDDLEEALLDTKPDTTPVDETPSLSWEERVKQMSMEGLKANQTRLRDKSDPESSKKLADVEAEIQARETPTEPKSEAQEWKVPDSPEKRQELIQVMSDYMKTKRINKEKISPETMRRYALLLAAENNIEINDGDVFSNVVWGHVQGTSTNLSTGYDIGSLIPIKINKNTDLDGRIRKAEKLRDELGKKWSVAEAIVNGNIKTTPKLVKRASEAINTVAHMEVKLAFELLNNETIPELYRLKGLQEQMQNTSNQVSEAPKPEAKAKPSRQKLSDTLSKSLSSVQVDATMKLYDAMFQGYADELGITLDEAYEYLSDVVTTMPEGEAMQQVNAAEIAEAERQMEEVRSKYEGTDQWLKAPNGKPTNLNERQWLQVRTENFKKWFGDWENDPKNASKVVDENGEPMVVYHGTRNTLEDNQFKSEYLGSFTNASSAQEAFFFTDEPEVANTYPDGSYDADRYDRAVRNMTRLGDSVYAAQEDLDNLISNRLDYDIEQDADGDYYYVMHDVDKWGSEWNYTGDYWDTREEAVDEAESEIDNQIKRAEKRVEEQTKLWEDRKAESEEGGQLYPVFLNIREPNEYDYAGGSYEDQPYTELIMDAKEAGQDGTIMWGTYDAKDRVIKSNIFTVFSPTQIKSATANVGTFDAENPDIRYQSIRGFVQFKDGKATLGIVDPDFSTAVHEQAHIGRRLISALALRDKTGKWKSLLDTAAAWAGAKDGNWDTAADEKFAQGYEKYLLEGKAPNPQVATLFGKIKEWMSAIVGKAKELAGIKLDDNIVSVYDAMLGMTREHKSNLNKEQKAAAAEIKKGFISPVEEKYGFTGKEAIAKGLIIPETVTSRYGKERIVGYVASNGGEVHETMVAALDAYYKTKEAKDAEISKINLNTANGTISFVTFNKDSKDAYATVYSPNGKVSTYSKWKWEEEMWNIDSLPLGKTKDNDYVGRYDAKEIDEYGYKLPSNYVKDGDVYVDTDKIAPTVKPALNKEQKAESIKLKNNMKLKNDTSSESLEKQLDSLMDKFGNLVYSRSSAKKSIITNVDLGKSIIEIIEDNGFVVNGKAFPTVYDAMQEITRLLSINTSTNSVTLKQIKRFNKSDDILFQRNIEKARDIKKQDQKKIASAYARVSNAVTRGISYTEWRNALIDLVDSLMVKHYGAYRVDYTTLMQIEDISLLNAALAKDQKYKTMMQDLTGYQDIAEVPTAQLFDIVSNLEPEYYESFMNNEYLKNLLDSTERISKALGKNSEPIMADIFRLTLELRNEDTVYGQISKGAYRPVEVIVSALGKGGVNLVTEGYKGKIRSARMQNRAHDTLKDFDKVLFSNKNNLGRRYTADERGTISSMIFYIGSNEAIKDHRAAFAEEVERVNKQGKEQIDLKDVLHIYDSLRSLMTFFEAEGMELNKRTGKQIFYSRPNYIFRVFQTVAMAMEEKLQDSEVRLAEAPNLMRRELKIPQMGKLNVDLMAATRSYVNRTSRYIAYYELKDYYYNQMSKDIPSNLRARADSLRDWVVKYVNNTIGIYEPKSKNDQNISNARLNLYASVLVSNIVLTLQNFNQRYLAKVYAAPGVWKQVKRDLHRITGSPKARIKSPKLIELIEELHASGENQLNQFYRESEEGKLKNNNLYARVTLATSGRVLQGSPFSRFERGNWSHGHLTGAYNAIMASRQYQNAIKDGKTHYQAVEIALGNQKVRDAALISAGEINAAVNADPSMVFSPAMYQDQVGKWLFFTKFFINYANMMKNTVAFKDIGSKWSRELFNYQLSGAEDQKVIADRIMSLNQMLQDLQPSRIKTLINQYGSRLTESQLEPADFAKAYVEIKKLRDEQVKYQRDHNTFFATGRGLQRRMIAGMASYMFGDFLIQMLIQLLKRLFYEDDPLGIYNKKMKKKLIAKTEINEVGMLLAVTQVSRLGQGIGIMSGLIPKPDFRTTKGFAKSMTSYILNLTPVLGLIDTAASQTYGAKPSHLILDSLFDDK